MAPALLRPVLSDSTWLYKSQYPVMLICRTEDPHTFMPKYFLALTRSTTVVSCGAACWYCTRHHKEQQGDVDRLRAHLHALLNRYKGVPSQQLLHCIRHEARRVASQKYHTGGLAHHLQQGQEVRRTPPMEIPRH